MKEFLKPRRNVKLEDWIRWKIDKGLHDRFAGAAQRLAIQLENNVIRPRLSQKTYKVDKHWTRCGG